MKYDNSDLNDMFQEHENILKEQEALNLRKKEFINKKEEYIKNYFESYGITSLRELPTSHNTFISSPKFYLKKSENGKIFWVASGNRITIKDGSRTYGSSVDELWQGQWETMPETMHKLTVEKAQEKTKPIFEMSPSVFRGVDYSAPAYILHQDPNGWQLVWRKAGTAYINRMSGSTSSNSGLQIIYSGDKKNEVAAWDKIRDRYNHATGKNAKFVTFSYEITEGGRLSVGLIEKESDKIDHIFGAGVAQSIVEKIKINNSNKNEMRKGLTSVAKPQSKKEKISQSYSIRDVDSNKIKV